MVGRCSIQMVPFYGTFVRFRWCRNQKSWMKLHDLILFTGIFWQVFFFFQESIRNMLFFFVNLFFDGPKNSLNRNASTRSGWNCGSTKKSQLQRTVSCKEVTFFVLQLLQQWDPLICTWIEVGIFLFAL